MGKKILRRRLHYAVELEAEPAAERLRHHIREAITGNDGRHRLAERRRHIPCERHRAVGGGADTVTAEV